MGRRKYSESQMAMVVKELENGARIGELCRKLGVSEATVYNWKKKYSGLGTPEIRKLRLLEEENIKLKQLVADLSLDKVMLQDILTKKD